MHGPSLILAEFVWADFLWAEFAMGRDVQLPFFSCSYFFFTTKQNKTESVRYIQVPKLLQIQEIGNKCTYTIKIAKACNNLFENPL